MTNQSKRENQKLKMSANFQSERKKSFWNSHSSAKRCFCVVFLYILSLCVLFRPISHIYHYRLLPFHLYFVCIGYLPLVLLQKKKSKCLKTIKIHNKNRVETTEAFFTSLHLKSHTDHASHKKDT